MNKSLSRVNIEEYAKARYFDTAEETPLLGDENALERRRRRMFYINIKWFMANLLDRNDRMGMAGGLEMRMPFCDHRIAEYAWNIPWDIKNPGGMEMGIMRLCAKDILPERILGRKKSPYTETYRPQYARLVSEALRRVLGDGAAPLHALIDKETVYGMLDSQLIITPWFGQLMTGPQLFAFLLQLNMWLTEYNIRIEV